jgi:eukaryotic-like serine/threonine-protein kinase
MTGVTAVRRTRTRAPAGEGAGRLEKVAVRTRIPRDPDPPTDPSAGRSTNPPAGRSTGGTTVPSMDASTGTLADAPTIRRLTAEETVRRSRTEAPVVLGRYRLRRRLGTGGFATVWLAHDERLDREVAVKILARERVIEGRFDREARAAARLAHPGIVTLYEAAVDDEGAYLVSERVRGTTLEALLAAGRLSDRDVVQIGIALCDALAHAHAHGVVHRDVKPSNVLVPDHPTMAAQIARLTDFGVARVHGGDSLTRTGDVIGTAAYMAPEQAEGLPAGAAADLFSLALVLYEGLSGVNPVRTGVTVRRAGMHLPPLRRQRRDLPRELGRAIDLSLRPRPGERGTLGELRAALIVAAGHVGDEPGVVADPWPARTERRQAEAHGERVAVPAPEAPDRRRAADWPRRALAGLAAAALTVWIVRRAPAALPIAPALLACASGVLVAALPRAGWLAASTVVAAALAIHGQTEAALVVAAGALIPVVLSPRDGPAWPLAAGAPALASLGLATAWPALAGLTRGAHRRATLAATGWLWTVLWAGGLARPSLTAGTFAVAGVWAAAAFLLPWTRSARWPALEAVRLALWAVALGLGTALAEHAGGAVPDGSALVGALAGALVTFATRRFAARLRRPAPANESMSTS